MGTVRGLSKYPYIREGRRLIGRASADYPQGFSIDEIDISRQNYEQPFYRQKLSPALYRDLKRTLASLGESGMQRTQSTVFPDSVGIGHYAIDIHGCMALSPPERAGNYERLGERQARAQTYPFQIPLRAMIPQKIDNLLVTGTNIATSHISTAAYRTQPIEWSAGAAAGMTATFALEQNIWAYQLVETLPQKNAQLITLQKRLRDRGNPISFPASPVDGCGNSGSMPNSSRARVRERSHC
jgi:FAD dependent oxidoreductase